jgi:ribonucleotide monophosphatase NagD (HAD superfamily)
MEIKALLLDIGGVLYEGDKPIDGAIEAIDKLKKKYKIKLLTNTTQRAPQTIIERLKKMGFNIEEIPK